MKFIKRVVAFIAVAGITLVFLYFFGDKVLAKLPANLFSGTVSKIASHAILEKSEPVRILETARLDERLVFPYDFIEKPYPNWALIKAQNERFLSETDRRNLVFYNDMLAVGFDLVKERDSFLILTVRGKAGYSFGDDAELQAFLHDASERTRSAELLSVDVSLPPREEGWPAVNLTPEIWQKIMAYLNPRIRNRPEWREFIELATKNGETFKKSVAIIRDNNADTRE